MSSIKTLQDEPIWVYRHHKDKPKQPTGKAGDTDWQKPGNQFTFQEAKDRCARANGLGMGVVIGISPDHPLGELDLIGIDMDGCRDPISGELSPSALKFLEVLDVPYWPSLTGTGVRAFCLGNPTIECGEDPDIEGLDDLSPEMKDHILAAKPTTGDKWNHFEMARRGPKHLTLTPEMARQPIPLMDRTAALNELLEPYVAGQELDRMELASRTGTGSRSRFPKLRIDEVIDLSGFKPWGPQLAGSHPILGSSTGHNLLVNVAEGKWCYMHAGINRGGDAWDWLACECGAVPWEQAGKGALKNRDVVALTMEHARARGLISADQLAARAKDSPTPPEPVPVDPEIREKALAIASRGDPLKYLTWQAQRNHLGDIGYQHVLIASIVSAASLTSHGIQPGGTGDRGSGKSDACVATYHLMPADRQLDGSLSPKSLYYLQENGLLKPGMVLFSDDVEYDGILPIYKRSTARFQHGATHYTVSSGKNRISQILHIPPRMVWWLTSVESVANEQAFDRQYPISTDSSRGHKKRVSKEIGVRRARKELLLAVDEGILVARAIFTDIFEHGPFRVLIPQAEKAVWLKDADFRGQEQFWDLVDALAILRWRQRRRDGDGWLVASDQDWIEAKDIMMSHKVAHISDLTEAEVKVVGVLSDGLPHSQKELTEALGIAQSTVSERLKSILAKSAIITEDFEQGRKLYSINPKMNLNTGYWQNLKLVVLEIDSEETYRSQQIALSGCYRHVIGLFIGIIINNSNRIPSSLSVNLGGCIEGRVTCDFCEVCPLAENFSSIHFSGKNYDNALFGSAVIDSDTDKSGDNLLTPDKRGLPMTIEPDKDTDKDIQRHEEQSKNTKVEIAGSGKDDLFLPERCLVCGAPCPGNQIYCSGCAADRQKTGAEVSV